MAIPTEAEFKAWLQIASRPLDIPPELSEAWEATHVRKAILPKTIAVDYYRAIRLEGESSDDRLRATPINSWLRGQREFTRAQRLVLFGRKVASGGREPENLTKIDFAKAVEDMFELGAKREASRQHGEDAALFSADAIGDHQAANKTDAEQRISRYVCNLLDFLARKYQPNQTWLYACVHALNEYYYGDAWRRSVALSKSLAASIQSAKKSIDLVVAQIDEAVSLDFSSRAFGRLFMIRASEGMSKSLSEISFPVQRNDVRACEKLFVFRLYKANRRFTKKPKTEAIAELMGLEGFRHQYDPRTIEKLCSGFAG